MDRISSVEQGDAPCMPVAAFILIEVTGDHTKSAYKTIQRMAGAKACYMVSGSYDILVQVEAESLEALSDLLLSKIRSVDGVTKTTTCMVLNM
jgi:DNA-binding Lrp family transcriptional regulator